MLSAQSKLLYQLNKFYGERVQVRKTNIAKAVREVCKVVQDVLKEVEVQEPRFISSLNDCNGRYDGFDVISPTEFEVVLYLNQMGVFNFVDDGSLPGCAVLKLSDGRKRSMSLWVEFITASGYLSARKIRSRFQTLVAQACDKCSYRDIVKMVADTTEVKLVNTREIRRPNHAGLPVQWSGHVQLHTGQYLKSRGQTQILWLKSRPRDSTFLSKECVTLTRQTIIHGRRCLGLEFHRGRKPSSARRLSHQNASAF
ncbi:protein mab-21-like 2 [Caerostris extrusa]|uniref:Protein mab-21-like 2 n=1 Tax=Caerostris extrusa TaxID=172846 RepID=A0AAV4MAJ0_CAEEX|nr:protein mab-21-like 2 [Caerostris extrusa]